MFLAFPAIEAWIQGAKTLGWGNLTEGMAVRKWNSREGWQMQPVEQVLGVRMLKGHKSLQPPSSESVQFAFFIQ